MDSRPRRLRHRALAAAAACLIGCAAALADDTAVQATWTPKPLRFTYMGFTTKYSCDGLQDKLRRILLSLGARADLKLTATGCEGFGRPTQFPGVSGTVQVLQPLGDQAPASDGVPVAASWQRIVVAPKGDPLNAAGDCELTEQVKIAILPLFVTRNVEYRSTCIPHQLLPGTTQLSAEVLVAVPKSPPAP